MAAATAAAGAAAAVSLLACYLLLHRDGAKLPWVGPTTRSSRSSGRRTRRKGLVEAIGNTPLIRINSLSDATGCEVDSGGASVFVAPVLLAGLVWFG